MSTGRRSVLLAWALALTGCLHSELVECGAYLCPTHTTCDLVHETCVTTAQASVCANSSDGEPCDAEGIPGICDRGYCVSGCGDGVLDPARTEECDDGNFASHDGCSSACVVEAATWIEVPSPWQPRFAHAAAYHDTAKKLVVFGGFDPDGTSADQWQRDDTRRWRDVTNELASKPPARSSAAMAYDPIRQVILMFGGRDPMTVLLADLWEYDGTTWTQRTPPTSPSARWGMGVAYDHATNTMLMFGGRTATGPTNETWRWDGATWTQLAPATAPSGRLLPMMASDTSRNRIVLFGGLVGGSSVQQDTWEWNGTTWLPITTTNPPASRYGGAMAYDEGRQKIVLFGGERGQGQATFSDSWEYGAAGWTPYAGLPTLPPGRYEASLSYDSILGSLVLVGGGRGSTRTPESDVWEYDATPTWSDATPAFPPARQSALAYDEARHQLVMFSGAIAGADTWTFAASRWSDVPATGSPAARRFHATAYDSRRDRVVVFGGLDQITGNYLDTTYEGTQNGAIWEWQPTTASMRPPPRESAAMVYDAKQGVIVLFGGITTGAVRLNDTWEYDGTTWMVRTGVAPPPARIPAMAYDPIRERTILVAEDGGTWAYADQVWTQLAGLQGPALIAASLTFDRTRGRIVLFGGRADFAVADTYELDDDGWHLIEIVGQTPGPRFLPAFAGLGADRCLVLFGGGATGGTIGDTWIFQYRSETLDEDCADGIDNDGDRHVDQADPDCDDRVRARLHY